MKKSVRILGHDYKVIVREDLGAFGKSCLSAGQIYIDPDSTNEQLISTLIHEAIEMINAQLELGMNHQAICGIETGIYQFLTENGIDLSVLLKDK